MRVLGIAGICILILFLPFGLSAQEFPLWGNLNPGPHAIGFQTTFQYDSSRPYKRKYDYEGNMQVGERSRPLQISFWYPAAAGTGTPMKFEDYVQLTAKEESAGEPSVQDKEQSTDGFLHSRWTQGIADEKIRELLKWKVSALRNAQSKQGSFPLVLVAHSVGMSYPYGNAVLCEYLASHGYIVATVPTIGLGSRLASFDSTGVMTSMQDLQFLIRHMRGFPAVDPDKLAVIGFSFGAMSGALLSMQNTDVDALVSLDGIIGNRFGYSVLFQNPLYEPSRLTAPVLHLTPMESTPDTEWKFFQSLKYSDVTTAKIKGMTTTDFCSFGAIAALIPKFAGSNQTNSLGHDTVCRYVLSFLDSAVKKNALAAAFLKSRPEENAVPEGLMTVETRSGFKVPPSESDFVKILQEKGISVARKIFNEVHENDPDYDLFEPETLNEVTQELIRKEKTKDAIEVQKLNVEVFPEYWLVYDVLGQAYMADGNEEKAIENFSYSLELNPENTNAAEMLKKLKKS